MWTKLACAICVAAVMTTARGDGAASFVPGDTVVSALPEDGADLLTFYSPGASAIDLRASAVPGLSLTLALTGPTGDAIDLSDYVRGVPGRSPAIRRCPLDVAGIYTLRVAADAGLGQYTLRSRLRPRRATVVDLRSGDPRAEVMTVRADQVRLSPSGQPPASRTLQTFADDVEARTVLLETASADLVQRVTATEGAITLAGLPGLRVAAKAPVGLVFQSQATTIVFPSGYSLQASVVKRGAVASAVFPPGGPSGPVTAIVKWTVRPNSSTSVSYFDVAPFAVWAEVGGKVVAGRSITDNGTEFIERKTSGDQVAYFDALGLGPMPTAELTTRTHLVTYHPTAAERAAGFRFDVLISASTTRSSEIPSFSIEIDSASVVAE